MDKELEELVLFWKNKLYYDRHLMPPSVQYLVQQTIKYLEKQLKETEE